MRREARSSNGEGPRPITHERAGRLLAGASVLVVTLLAWLVSPLFLFAVAAIALNLALSGITDRCAVKSLLRRLGFPGERDLGRAEALEAEPSRRTRPRAVAEFRRRRLPAGATTGHEWKN